MAAVGEGEAQQVQKLITEFLASQSQQPPNNGDQNMLDNMAQESGEFDKELFLQALRDFKCLWDTSDPNYKSRTMKLNAWKSLSQMFNQEGK